MQLLSKIFQIFKLLSSAAETKYYGIKDKFFTGPVCPFKQVISSSSGYLSTLMLCSVPTKSSPQPNSMHKHLPCTLWNSLII